VRRSQRCLLAVAGGAVALLGLAGCSMAADGAVSTSSAAFVVPGLAALDGHSKRTAASVTSVSCPAAGDCAATGYYFHDGIGVVFVVNESHGIWGLAKRVRGSAAYRREYGGALPEAISCASPGNCSVVGNAGSQSISPEGFAVSEAHGTWGSAKLIRGVADITSVSCPKPGYCSAAGYHTGRAWIGPYMISQINGVWGRPAALPHATVLYHSAGWHPVEGLSCASPGNCAATGKYQDPRSLRWRAYVASQVHGAWRAPRTVSGLPALNAGAASDATSVSCASPGNCVAGGYYQAWGRSHEQPFVISEVNGTWQAAIRLQDLSVNNPNQPFAPGGPRFNEVTSVSCSSAGNCTAAGTAVGFASDGFVAREVNGLWATAQAIKAPITTGNNQWIIQSVLLSCSSPGTCAVAGYYGDPFYENPYVVTEVNGTWATARADPNALPFIEGKWVQFGGLSCAPHAGCVAGGLFGTGVTIPGQQDTEYTQGFLLKIR
jgi:hypothetical protein